MPSRREFLFGAGGAFVGGVAALGGATLLDTGYGSIEWANHTGDPVVVGVEVTADGGLLGSDFVAYENSFTLWPTSHYRVTDQRVVETDTYEVSVTVESESGDRLTGPVETTWRAADCSHQRLIVTVNPDASVEFLQDRC